MHDGKTRCIGCNRFYAGDEIAIDYWTIYLCLCEYCAQRQDRRTENEGGEP